MSKEKKGNVVDARCRDLTNSANCEKGRANPGSTELCDWHEVRTIGLIYPSALKAFYPESWETGAGKPHPSWNMDTGRRPRVRQRKGNMPLLRSSQNGESLYQTLQSRRQQAYFITLDAFRRHHYILVPLPPRSKGCRSGIKGVFQRRYSCIRRGPQHR